MPDTSLAALKPPVRCERCHRFPPLRITPDARELARGVAPTVVLATWRCACGRVHPITAAAYVRAA